MSEDDLKPYWNCNVVRHPAILRAVPERCRDALDVGCGDGLLVRKLASRANRVTGIDKSDDMISRARELAAGYRNVSFMADDFASVELSETGYDFICSVATIHHMDFAATLTRMRELLRPRGRLVVVGLARDASLADWAKTIVGFPTAWVTRTLHRSNGPEGLPMTPPVMSYDQVRDAARRLLPGVLYRRHMRIRYSLVWEAPDVR